MRISELEKAVAALVDVDMAPMSINRACQHYRDMRAMQAYIEGVVKTLDARVDEAAKHLLPQKFKEEDTPTITTGGFRFSISDTVRASMKDKEAGYNWLEHNGLSALITSTVNSSTLAAEARRRMEAGEALPAEIFNVIIQSAVSMTKVG